MRKLPLHTQILLAMLLGTAIGVPLNLAVQAGSLDREVALSVARVGEWAGQIFLSLLNMVVVPLVFSSLVSSLTQLGRSHQGSLARLGLRTIVYYLATSLLAIGTGMILVNLIRPGDGLSLQVLLSAASGELETLGKSAPDVSAVAAAGPFGVLAGLVQRMVPTNVFAAATENREILSVIVFAVMFAVAAVRAGEPHATRVSDLATSVYEVMLTLTYGVLATAPIGIFGYVLFVTASTGLEVAAALGWYLLTVALGLAFHAFVTLPLLLWFFTRRSPLAYAKALSEALLTAFSTASSSGTLPLTLRCVTENGGVSERTASFTLPLGATVNMDGTALYEAVAVLFVAQMSGDLSFGQQLLVAFTALLASVGAAGIPHAGTVMMVIVLQSVGLPTDAVLVILSVDRLLDMGRTAVNVWSDAVGAAIVDPPDLPAPG